MLEGAAPKVRGTKHKATPSLLAGKLFDETGDRLTPSHSRKNGKRLRYYISHRLVKDRSQKHPDAWRLPAEQLVGLIADLVKKHLQRHDAVPRIVRDLTASEIAAKSSSLNAIQQTKQCLKLVARAGVSPGALIVRLSPNELARALKCDADRINTEELTLTSPFRMRHRGVELKLHLGEASSEVDLTLVQNIVKAQKWLAMALEGKTFTEIAEAEITSKRRVQDVVDLATLAPDVLDTTAGGEQPNSLTSDYLIKSGVPTLWSDQREQFAKL